MPEIVERTLVDNHLATARRAIGQAPSDVDPAADMLANVIVECAAAIVHQIRDADDTIATVQVPAFEREMNDLTTTLRALPSGEEITNAIRAASGKRGLF